jgi:hypothetical protein
MAPRRDACGDVTIRPEPFVAMVTSAGIQLNGKSCDDYRNGIIKSVRVDLSCTTR